jgi:cytochrome c
MNRTALRGAVCALALFVVLQPARALDIVRYPVGSQVGDSAVAAEIFRQADARPVQPFVLPTLDELPLGAVGERVRYGMALLQRSSELLGPRQPDAALRHSRNDLNCVSCHQAGPSGLPGSKPFGLPLVNVRNDYPKLDPKTMKVTSIEMRIAGMLGPGATPIKADSREMQAMVAYIDWLGSKIPPGRAMAGTGLDEAIAMPARAADVARGGTLYAAKCSVCHGAQGLGLKNGGFERGMGYQFPPIAGDDAYDDGGHMYMVPLLTRFLRSNMPLGASADQPLLSVDDAYDIAAFVNTDLPRKHSTTRPALYPDPRFRAIGFAIPENFPGDDAAYRKAGLGPFDAPH